MRRMRVLGHLRKRVRGHVQAHAIERSRVHDAKTIGKERQWTAEIAFANSGQFVVHFGWSFDKFRQRFACRLIERPAVNELTVRRAAHSHLVQKIVLQLVVHIAEHTGRLAKVPTAQIEPTHVKLKVAVKVEALSRVDDHQVGVSVDGCVADLHWQRVGQVATQPNGLERTKFSNLPYDKHRRAPSLTSPIMSMSNT